MMLLKNFLQLITTKLKSNLNIMNAMKILQTYIKSLDISNRDDKNINRDI